MLGFGSFGRCEEAFLHEILSYERLGWRFRARLVYLSKKARL